MQATDIFRQDHGIIRRALACLDKALLMQSPGWTIVAKNVATYLDVDLREYVGAEERWVLRPLAETGPDAARVVSELESEHRKLEVRLAELKVLAVRLDAADSAPLLREKGVALVKEFLHHMFLEEEVAFPLAEQRLGAEHLEEGAAHMRLLKETVECLEEPAAID